VSKSKFSFGEKKEQTFFEMKTKTSFDKPRPPSPQIRPVFCLEDKKGSEKEESTEEGPRWFFFHSKKTNHLRFFFRLDNHTVATKKKPFLVKFR